MSTTSRNGPLSAFGAAVFLAAAVSLALTGPALAQTGSACVECHTQITPGIVQQWQAGKMGASGMDCSACHGSDHQTASDAASAVMPAPGTCALCHPKQVEQYRAGKHSLAWAAMKAMPMLDQQPGPIGGGEGFKGCSGCHKVGEKSVVESKDPALRYGIGSCDSCHTRHSFSKAEAQDPRACQTCHMGFDHPQWEMWSTSKHGTIWAIEGNSGRAPTCQKCHMSEGDHGVMTPWGFLAVRAPEEDQEWWADRVEILKALGVLDENGEGTERLEAVKAAKIARLSAEEFAALRAEYETTCRTCHAPGFVAEQMAANDRIVREADALMTDAILVVKDLYADGLLVKPEKWKYAPDLLQFYEAQSSIEQELYRMFMEFRMRTFQGGFHNNPDYLHWYGWAEMKESLQRIEDEATALRAEDELSQSQDATQKQIAHVQAQVDQAAAPKASPELLAVQATQQSTQQELADVKGAVAQVSGDLDALAAETQAVRGEVAAARAPQPLAWIAGIAALAALVIGIVALARRRA